MKKVKTICLIAMLYCTVNNAEAFALEAGTPVSIFTQKNINTSIHQLINILEKNYVFPENAKVIVKSLKEKSAKNGFKNSGELPQFINELSIFIRHISGDNYLDIIETNPLLSIENSLSPNQSQRFSNQGLEKFEVLAGNIGYLKLTHFYQASLMEGSLNKAFSHLSKTDAIILDLRDVEGDSMLVAQHIMSIFVEHNTVLANVLYDRQKQTQVLKSSAFEGFDSFKNDFPLYILTSSFVSPTGEFLSYTLKHLNKAVIVGEKTMGVAPISRTQIVNEFISINLPVAIPIHPTTNTNWLEEGVIPDVNEAANLSFDKAYQLAKNHLGIF